MKTRHRHWRPQGLPGPVTGKFPSHQTKHASFLHKGGDTTKGMLLQTSGDKQGPYTWGANGTIQELSTLGWGSGPANQDPKSLGDPLGFWVAREAFTATLHSGPPWQCLCLPRNNHARAIAALSKHSTLRDMDVFGSTLQPFVSGVPSSQGRQSLTHRDSTQGTGGRR